MAPLPVTVRFTVVYQEKKRELSGDIMDAFSPLPPRPLTHVRLHIYICPPCGIAHPAPVCNGPYLKSIYTCVCPPSSLLLTHTLFVDSGILMLTSLCEGAGQTPYLGKWRMQAIMSF